MASLREAYRKAESMERKRDYAIEESKRLEQRIAQLEAALADAAVPREIADAAWRINEHLLGGTLYHLGDVGDVVNFILSLAAKKGGA